MIWWLSESTYQILLFRFKKGDKILAYDKLTEKALNSTKKPNSYTSFNSSRNSNVWAIVYYPEEMDSLLQFQLQTAQKMANAEITQKINSLFEEEGSFAYSNI